MSQFNKFPGATIAELERLEQMSARKPQVFLGMPHYGEVSMQAAWAFLGTPSERKILEVVNAETGSSLLARGFNTLWTAALTMAEAGQVTHFCLIHADIAPERYWLDMLMEEMQKQDADVLGVVSPIKDGRGLTSIAVDDPENPWEPAKRLTMTEVCQLPESFDADDLKAAGMNPKGSALLVNTGLLLVDLRRNWCRAYNTDTGEALAYFTIRDRVRRVDGHWHVDCEPEDWWFSRRAASAGARIVATRRVRLEHIGRSTYPNDTAWGTWPVDSETCKPPEVEPETQEQATETVPEPIET